MTSDDPSKSQSKASGAPIPSLVAMAHESLQITSTLASNRKADDIVPEEDPGLDSRRRRLYRAFENHHESLKFNKLMDSLGLLEEYYCFVRNFTPAFTGMALRVPALVGKKIIQTVADQDTYVLIEADFKAEGKEIGSIRQQLNSTKDIIIEPINKENEKGLVKCFGEIARSSHKMGFTFHYPYDNESLLSSIHIPVEAKSKPQVNINDKDFGQVADYAAALWECQPTRTFVPVLFINGVQLSMFVFTRDICYRTELGAFCHSNAQVNEVDASRVGMTLCRLAFLLTRPPKQFGQFCDTGSCKMNYIQFAHPADGSGLAHAEIGKISSDTMVEITEKRRIKRPINPRGRLSHVFDTVLGGRKVFLKLSWTPVNRLPESAVYSVLQSANIPYVPTLLDSGIIDKDTFGYRVEYLIIADAGKPLAKHLEENAKHGIQKVSELASTALKQVSICLVKAWDAGILHRDVSEGNVVIKNGQATLIDWGYAKLIPNSSLDIDALARKWFFDKDLVMENEELHDSLTGTPLYMSVKVLTGSNFRGVEDDVESMLYVVLNALSENSQCGIGKSAPKPPALDFKDMVNLAHVRSCCLSIKSLYKASFGVKACSDALDLLLDKFRNYLFVRDGEYIGCRMAMDSNYKQSVDIEQLSQITGMTPKPKWEGRTRASTRRANDADTQDMPPPRKQRARSRK
ncbi:hypothetical protein BX667DRAFT_523165 [Coemansia mojavensis]|nr:hypothetical protein BX667DRAFT_523165 [Coemansia mojavensis]